MEHKILYVCNRKRCADPGAETCGMDECKRTTDIHFALYDDHPEDQFEEFGDALVEMEREEWEV